MRERGAVAHRYIAEEIKGLPSSLFCERAGNTALSPPVLRGRLPHSSLRRAGWESGVPDALMKKLLYASTFAALLATGCGSMNVPNHPSGLPLRYHSAQYDLTFFLPASWQGYSVLVEQWVSSYSAAPEH